MEIKILQTGSKGNASIITDADGNQLLIDAGLKYDRIAKHIYDFSKLTVVCTHAHGDHALCIDRFVGLCKVIGVGTAKHKQIIQNGVWTIMPLSVPHGECPCFAYIIVNNLERKKIFWATDLTALPRLAAPDSYDLFAVECNYETDLALEAVYRGDKRSKGYQHHLSVETLRAWFSSLEARPQNLCLLHLSNSGLINRDDLPMLFRGFCRHNFYIGDKNCTFRI